MGLEQKPKVAIVDYGMGNLFSVRQACEHAGLDVGITSERAEILKADAVILPGIGAFGDAMATLSRLDLVGVLQDVAASGKELVGVCLGLQLLMSESFEFGRHKGLGIIEGQVVPFDHPAEGARKLKVPQVGWNSIHHVGGDGKNGREDAWENSPFAEIRDGEFMYFVHSYIVQPENKGVILSVSRYGHIEFCSSIHYQNIFACQFHPERSGREGLKIYCNLASHIQRLTSRGVK
ncbi:MAG: imidazole glycerol-phosphate synthase subunit HisH [Acidobacteriota bacterium]|jgi:glutamine amidotransferase|nr:imidazole glycerol-phosphate synthase subunit HisH [Acidobacteriota bacterium]